MGRKPNPHGKDRTRTIQLDGDLADIAQKLADKSQLSKTLSQLLRQSYGMSDNITQLELALIAATDERKELQQREEQLIDEITAARDSLIQRQNHILPSMYQRQGALEVRLAELQKKLQVEWTHQGQIKLQNQVNETNKQLQAVLSEIKELES